VVCVILLPGHSLPDLEKLRDAAELVNAGIEETLSYFDFPREHWRCLRTNNPLERMMREIRRRTRVVGAFPDGSAAALCGGHALGNKTVSEHDVTGA
jgi:transposase-like protein